ncbi:hypothetical protein LINGRAHAP2_LOCUS5474 [Linum grandiflorum]
MQERLDRQSREAAEAAIKLYNRRHGVNYEFEVALNSNGITVCGLDYIHVNFTAKDLNDLSAPSTLFFAEVRYTGGLTVSMNPRECVIVDPKETDPLKISKGCVFCSSDFAMPILHAVGHHTFGKYEKFCYVVNEYESDDDDDWW